MIAQAKIRLSIAQTIALSVGVSVFALSGCTTSSGPDLELVGQGFSQNQAANVASPPQGLTEMPQSRPQDGVSVAANQIANPQAENILAPMTSDVAQPNVPVALPSDVGLETAQLDIENDLSTAGISAVAQFPVAPAPQTAFSNLPEGTVIASANPLPVPADAPLNLANQIEVTPIAEQPNPSTFAAQGFATPVTTTAIERTTPLGKSARPVGQGLFASLFSKRPSQNVTNPAAPTQQAFAATNTNVSARIEQAAPRPVTLPSSTQGQSVTSLPTASVAPRVGTQSGLPGVNTTNLFNVNDETDEEPTDRLGRPAVQLASATPGGLARLTPRNIETQTERVEVDCFKPELVRVLQRIERNYGRKAVVTSGYRSPTGNSKSGGASKSLHMYCAAADIQVEGVSKWELAKFVRSMPGRGGVGTYCHTESVHVDIGSKRDWNWRCRRR